MSEIAPILFLVSLIVGGIYCGFIKVDPGEAGRGYLLVLVLLLAPIAGLLLAGAIGSETLGWVSGLTLMVAVPLILFAALAYTLGRLFRWIMNRTRQ
jgi:hypothetical protein